MPKRSKKHVYRALEYRLVDWRVVVGAAVGDRIVLGIDIAKTTMFAVAMDVRREVLVTFKWNALNESRPLVSLLSRLGIERVECAMEPSGTYGEPLRELLWEAGLPVFRVSPKRCHDFSEVYDGVPSSHDAKSAALVAYLHWSAISEVWPRRSTEERGLKAAVRTMAMLDDLVDRSRNRIEAQLACHWPELPQFLDLDGAALLELLAMFGSPAAVTQHAEAAGELMSRVGGRFLKAEKVKAVLASAPTTIGVPMVPEEQEALAVLAAETRRLQLQALKARRRVERLARRVPEACRMGEVVGLATAAVLIATAGSPKAYPNAGSWVKSLGLNLKERSSGLQKGQPRITKRGPSLARKYQYLAVVRWLKDQPLAHAWYTRKVQRDGGAGLKALVALMRKCAGALWWVSRGVDFDPARLFDQSRLVVSEQSS